MHASSRHVTSSQHPFRRTMMLVAYSSIWKETHADFDLTRQSIISVTKWKLSANALFGKPNAPK